MNTSRTANSRPPIRNRVAATCSNMGRLLSYQDEAARSIGATTPHCHTCPRLSAVLSPGEGGRTVTEHRHGIDMSCNKHMGVVAAQRAALQLPPRRGTGCLQIAIGRASRPFPRSKRSRPWDRLPARYLPARLQQPSPKLGMELSPHHSFPEVTVGVVPAPAHHVRFLRTLSSSCLPSPCLRLSRGPWSGITPTSTMQAP